MPSSPALDPEFERNQASRIGNFGPIPIERIESQPGDCSKPRRPNAAILTSCLVLNVRVTRHSERQPVETNGAIAAMLSGYGRAENVKRPSDFPLANEQEIRAQSKQEAEDPPSGYRLL